MATSSLWACFSKKKGTSQPTPPSPILNDGVIQITIPVSTKLVRDNFLTWKSEIEPIINEFGLSHHLDTSVSPPARNLVIEGVPQINLSFLSWDKQDQILLRWLRSSITEPVLSQYATCQTAGQLWTSLHRVFVVTVQYINNNL